MLLFCICGKLLISDNPSISCVDYSLRDQLRTYERSSVPEEAVISQPHHCDDILSPVIPPPISRYSSSCSSIICCRVWNSNTRENICSVCKKPISKYDVHQITKMPLLFFIL